MIPEKRLKLRKFGPFSFQMDTLTLKRNGVVIPLRPKAAKLLAILLEHEGELVEHDQLRKALWDDRVVEWHDGLHQAVRDVRLALEDGSETPSYITNVPRRGYKILCAQQPDPKLHTSIKYQRTRYFGMGAITFPLLFLVVCAIAVNI